MTHLRHRDQFTRCECGHEYGHHKNRLSNDPTEPHQCRLCECEAFMSPRERAALLAIIADD